MTMVSDIHLLYNPRRSQELIVLVPTCQAGLVAGQQDSGTSKTRVFTTRRVNDPFKIQFWRDFWRKKRRNR